MVVITSVCMNIENFGTISPIVLVLLVRRPEAITFRVYPVFSTKAITRLRVVVCTCGWLFNTREIVAGDNFSALARSWIEFLLFCFGVFIDCNRLRKFHWIQPVKLGKN